MEDQIVENVKEYYGKELSGSKDLKTSACCSADTMPSYQRTILKHIHKEITSKFYGCGSPIPFEVKGKTILDLGCGTGRDVFILSKLVGPNGKVIGVDMTTEQLGVATKHIDSQMTTFGFDKPNVEFKQGYMEDLAALGIQDGSVDIVISNCVLNLSPHKAKVFKEIFRVLKPGGELIFSDVFSSRRIPSHLKQDPVLYGECLSGALYVEDFRRILHQLGYPDFRIIKSSPITLHDESIRTKLEMIDFSSLTIRVFKLDDIEDKCEDYGQTATYKGTIEHSPHSFVLDDHHTFEVGKPLLVCGNTASMLSNTRFSPHFTLTGDRSIHYGLFDCSQQTKHQDSEGGCC